MLTQFGADSSLHGRLIPHQNPSGLSGEFDRDEEEDVDFEIPPEAGDLTKVQREEEGRQPKAIEELDRSVPPYPSR
jgi:hypothetical protein